MLAGGVTIWLGDSVLPCEPPRRILVVLEESQNECSRQRDSSSESESVLAGRVTIWLGDSVLPHEHPRLVFMTVGEVALRTTVGEK